MRIAGGRETDGCREGSRPLLRLFVVVTFVAGMLVFTAIGSAQEAQKESSPEPKQEAAEKETPPPEAAPETEEPQQGEQRRRFDWVHGSFDAGFDGAWSDGGNDIDLDQTLQLRIDPPQLERLHIRGSLWMLEDLDSDEPSNSALRDVNDAYDSDVRARLLSLYVELDDLWGDSTLRLGRQRIEEGVAWNRIDGAYFKQRLDGWDWYVFGGARASVYTDAHEDLAFGGGTSLRLRDNTRVALDVYYGKESRFEDERLSIEPSIEPLDILFPRRLTGYVRWALTDRLGIPTPWEIKRSLQEDFLKWMDYPYLYYPEEDIDNTQVSLSVWHAFNQNLTLFGRFSWLNDDGSELVLDATGMIPAWDLTYELTFRALLDSFGDRVNDLTGYYRIMGEFEEYQDFLVALHRPLTDKVTLSLEGEVHRADSDENEMGNRDYERYAVILSADKLWKDVSGSIAFEKWEVEEGEDVTTVSGEVSRQWGNLFVALGADYERYVDRVVYDPTAYRLDQLREGRIASLFQPFTSYPFTWLTEDIGVETHENVHSVYTKARWTIRDDQELYGRVTYEEDDGPDSPYWRVEVNYTIRF